MRRSAAVPPQARSLRVEVVAAVLQREDGAFLLAQRPAGKVYAGYWEFPGGKIERGETATAALARELHEELGIEVEQAYPWLTRDYDYEHANVRLRFYRVTRWSGELHGREDQQFAWQRIEALGVSPLLPANAPILRALALPTFYAVSNMSAIGAAAFLERLKRAFDGGLRLVQIREKQLADDALADLAHEATALAHRYGAAVLVNTDPVSAARSGADGVHLSATRLMRLAKRPQLKLVGASCHNLQELQHAARIGVDLVALGPVHETASHVGAVILGWTRFRELIANYPVPVFAIGGMQREDLVHAWHAGAHGIAAIRSAWVE